MATKKKSASKTTPLRSFKRSPNNTPFYTFQFTQQSVYWVVITFLILAIGAWVLYLTVKIERVYDFMHVSDSANQDVKHPTRY